MQRLKCLPNDLVLVMKEIPQALTHWVFLNMSKARKTIRNIISFWGLMQIHIISTDTAKEESSILP